MLSASTNAANIFAQPNLTFLAGSGSSFSVYSPAQIRAAYGFNSLSYNGAGQTIAIVDAYSDPTIAADLARFDQQFGLAAPPKFTIAQQYNGSSAPAANSGWAMETAFDVEWAHAIAPGANILLVEANSASLSSLLSAVNYARQQAGVSVVSMSWGASDFSGEGTYDSYFTTPAGHTGVTFVASSGDNGAGASWPAISSNVLAVGGTTLSLNANGTYGGESAWSGSGGGYSAYESEPSFQRSVQTTGKRSDPDVSYDANPNTGFYVYDSGGWYAVGGTSAGTPQWSGLIALANQGRAQAGKAALNNALANVYGLASTDFHDITTGSNGYAAKAGYDLATGRGSPIANLVVKDLVNATNAATTSSNTSNIPITGTFKATSKADGGTSLGGLGIQQAASQQGFDTSGHSSSGDSDAAAASSTSASRWSAAADELLTSVALTDGSASNLVGAAAWHAGDQPGGLVDSDQPLLGGAGDQSDLGLTEGWQAAADQLADTVVAAGPANSVA